VLLQFHRDGQRINSIAAGLAVPPGTVKSLLHRARTRMWAAARDQEES
jgi:DNA-directed RNA polymerase specialized sigma24 family protein